MSEVKRYTPVRGMVEIDFDKECDEVENVYVQELDYQKLEAENKSQTELLVQYQITLRNMSHAVDISKLSDKEFQRIDSLMHLPIEELLKEQS